MLYGIFQTFKSFAPYGTKSGSYMVFLVEPLEAPLFLGVYISVTNAQKEIFLSLAQGLYCGSIRWFLALSCTFFVYSAH